MEVRDWPHPETYGFFSWYALAGKIYINMHDGLWRFNPPPGIPLPQDWFLFDNKDPVYKALWEAR